MFSAEGTVGKTFVICDVNMKFITNIHGIILSPIDNKNDNKSIFLGMYLSYLRNIGYIQKMAVGGQGGSFAVGYWDRLLIPDFDNELIREIAKIYKNDAFLSPWVYNEESISEAGIFALNNFRMKCKEILDRLILDIKKNKVEEISYYRQYYS